MTGDVLSEALKWLSTVVLALVGLVYRSLNARIASLEENDENAHQRIYDKIEALRLENKSDHREARADIVARLEALSKQMSDRDALATKLVRTLRGDDK